MPSHRKQKRQKNLSFEQNRFLYITTLVKRRHRLVFTSPKDDVALFYPVNPAVRFGAPTSCLHRGRSITWGVRALSILYVGNKEAWKLVHMNSIMISVILRAHVIGSSRIILTLMMYRTAASKCRRIHSEKTTTNPRTTYVSISSYSHASNIKDIPLNSWKNDR
jgi:hypothetical protein